ncbi:hypothetical protein CDL12_04605 [Handroanthus impetiginosus]|uniref:Uncharacterized protein n=1 Tax=Handroanthus impetiginosus TaxID=429701 RepID=A0A2G9HYV2_9LAMI|nr:hypothetical protein CDL12_04605 [Handroanthus impetiginosus]
MEESSLSLNSDSRKRKRSSPLLSDSNSLIGVITRSKSRIYFDHNGSGVARSEQVSGRPISFRPEVESVEAFLEVDCKNVSRVSSIKDLRMRRVSTPDVNSVLGEEEVENEQGKKKKLKDSDAGLNSNQVMNPDVSDAKLDEPEKSEAALTETQDEQNDIEKGSKDQPGNGSISKSKTALNRCSRRKVFKTLSSFSYRRLLPYLMDIASDDSSVHKIEIVDARIPCKLQKLDGANSEKVEAEDVKSFPTKVPSNQQDFSGAENELGRFAEIVKLPEVDQKGHENDLHRVRASTEEECGQTTPPDPDIFIKTHEESVEANNILADNQDFKGSLVGTEKGNDVVLRWSPNGKRGANSNNGAVLNPCSHLRLFNNPRSLSYRRLLPFLMDISNSNTCASRTTPQVDLKEDIHPVWTSTAELNSMNETTTENFYEKKRAEDGSSPDISDSLVSSMPQSFSTNVSSKIEPSAVTSETLADPCTLMSMQAERTPQPKSSPRKLEQGFNPKENLPPSYTVNNDNMTEQSTSQEAVPAGKQKMCSDMGSGLDNMEAKLLEKVKFLNQSSSDTGASNAFVTPTSGPLKGILKKNRRGCRGLCNCLNCASFRLHANRAFEFSQNQMHDAEEVASDLMKELANLRLLLDKSIVNDKDLAAINPVIIKQACSKALEAENVAKERLSQLNDDLNVHCRIPVLVPPKVTFAADRVQERAIPVLDRSTNTQKKG